MAPVSTGSFACILILFYVSQLFVSSDCQEMQKMKFKSPMLSEEERESEHITDALKCDACQAIAHRMNEVLRKAETKTKAKVLTESGIIDVLEKLCTEGFEEYGLKDMDGMNHLSGPGLAAEGTPGLVQMGGKWPKRIREMCFMKLGDIGEEEIYAVSRSKDKILFHFLCTAECDLGKRARSKKSEL